MPVFLRRPVALLLAAASPWSLAIDDVQAGDVVTVKAERQHYRSLSATGATKTDALLMDLPQSVRVLTSDLLRDAGVTTLAGALDLASGISKQSPLGGLWDSYAMRGFTGDPNFGSDYMVNGFSSSRGYNGMRDGGNTQNVEVLKGPASALYGRGEPGGTVNIATKKPKFAPEYGADVSLGSFQTRRTALDLTGPLSDTFAYRLNAAHEEGHSFRDTLKVERSLFSPSFIWLAGEHTTVSYEIEAVRQRAPFDRGVVAVNGKLGAVPVSRFLGEPGDGPMTVKSLGQQLFIHHALSDDWTLQAGASYRDSELRGYSTEANKLLADGRTLNRQRRHRDFWATDVSARVELLGKFKTGALAHEVLAGVDAYRFDDHRVQLRRNPSAANAYAIDIFNPVYGGKAAPLALSIDTQEGQRARGLYAQDQIDLGAQWKALVGVRRDSYTQDVANHRLNVSNRQSLSATSPRAGLVYQPSTMWSLYASAAKGFRPNSGISIDNQAFPAERSRSYELGAKLETGKLTGTVAVYDIRKSNVLTTNPANTDFAIAAGEVGSRGLELDVSGELARGLRVSGAYAYTNATVTRGDNTIVTGSRFANVPRHSANLLATQQFALVTGTASVGGGFQYVGERLGDVAVSSQFTLPAYTTARLLASYAPNARLRLALSVENLFNRSYYASSYSQLWVATGAERTVTLNAHYRF
ncbi:ferrichrome-iron receptor precursor [Janthinobacterium sp. HH103]|uniref:TonB-dependent siderophore receptor n=1 Tax=unclassified Janthinobacterium TaxID=2610881 RepID=UPI000875416F|nr:MULTISPECIES: TonB-dependent siderophore receptor [unclassified Janthinobacterium]OEZ69331.1 ferrichrome-iron receptor precursor [Janthinobacterium sp. HH100]OEZ73111.1 ferrichrome-iron receptor precursor [Janthinobacterium sp. HH103]QOU73159.1 Ferrichrome outer membrane transporter/phage receptor [Janthinobacterium sp. HH102]